jgi:hypothetical protein
MIGEKIEGAGKRQRRRMQLMDNFKERSTYRKLNGSTILYSLENSLRKRLWNYRKADYATKKPSTK